MRRCTFFRQNSTSFMRVSAARVSRPKSCCGRCGCKQLYSMRSERQRMEQLDYNPLFRWFVGLAMDAPVWDASTFSKIRDRVA
jgi:hypothetical protein